MVKDVLEQSLSIIKHIQVLPGARSRLQSLDLPPQRPGERIGCRVHVHIHTGGDTIPFTYSLSCERACAGRRDTTSHIEAVAMETIPQVQRNTHITKVIVVQIESRWRNTQHVSVHQIRDGAFRDRIQQLCNM